MVMAYVSWNRAERWRQKSSISTVNNNLAPIALEIVTDYPDADFLRYWEEAKPIAEEIIKNLAE